jgi:hypothetical protein
MVESARFIHMIEGKDILLLLVGSVISVGSGLAGAWIQRKIDQRSERRPLRQLLNFGPGEVLLIFPHRDQGREAILPRTSTEDFLAMNNVISALLNVGWSRGIGVRDTTRFTDDDRKRNLVIICSPKSNEVAAEFQTILKRERYEAFFFEQNRGGSGNWYISTPDLGISGQSPSWDQEKKYREETDGRLDLSTKKFDDLAVITKIQNPWNNKTKIIMVAGIRGIGTWGAAECVKKHWREIYDRLPRDQKDCDFSALLSIQYENSDITSFKVSQVLQVKQNLKQQTSVAS